MASAVKTGRGSRGSLGRLNQDQFSAVCRMRIAGLSWSEIKQSIGYEHGVMSLRQIVKYHCGKRGVDWPIKPFTENEA